MNGAGNAYMAPLLVASVLGKFHSEQQSLEFHLLTSLSLSIDTSTALAQRKDGLRPLLSPPAKTAPAMRSNKLKNDLRISWTRRT